MGNNVEMVDVSNIYLCAYREMKSEEVKMGYFHRNIVKKDAASVYFIYKGFETDNIMAQIVYTVPIGYMSVGIKDDVNCPPLKPLDSSVSGELKETTIPTCTFVKNFGRYEDIRHNKDEDHSIGIDSRVSMCRLARAYKVQYDRHVQEEQSKGQSVEPVQTEQPAVPSTEVQEKKSVGITMEELQDYGQSQLEFRANAAEMRAARKEQRLRDLDEEIKKLDQRIDKDLLTRDQRQELIIKRTAIMAERSQIEEASIEDPIFDEPVIGGR
jgi:hypothetical protein